MQEESLNKGFEYLIKNIPEMEMFDNYSQAKIFGENIKKYRRLKNMSVKNLAEKSNIMLKILSDIEKGALLNVTIKDCFKLRNALGISFSDMWSNIA